MKNYENLMLVDLAMFDGNTNVTTDSGLSAEMKTYYSDYLIDHAEPKLVHGQFAQKQPIPKNGGKTIEFRKYSALPKALTPLTEGVTPDGQKLNVSTITCEVKQYGDFVPLSDMLLMTAIDNNLERAIKLLGSQAGRTLDTVTREVLCGGTNVRYAGGKTSRAALTEDDKLTVDLVRKGVRDLKKMNAEKIDGYYVAIVNQDTAHDLMDDPDWKYPHQYSDPKNIYEGEIGAIAGVRFVETSEGKIFADAGSGGRDVYATLLIGDNAYGETEIQGGGLETIIKQLGSAGTADALNQRASAAWKATHAAVILSNEYMVRLETTSSFNDGEAN
jgi:N4-gp56 family major capsid protein